MDEKSGNNIVIHKTDGTSLSERKTFKSALEAISSDIMVQINKGVIVNVAHIKKIENNFDIILYNGKLLTVSRIYHNVLKEKYFEYERAL